MFSVQAVKHYFYSTYQTSTENHNPLKKLLKSLSGYGFCTKTKSLNLLLSLFLLYGCSKDDFTADLAADGWSPEIAFPLAYAEISMMDLAHVNDSTTTIIVDENKFCTLIYQENVFKITSAQLVTVPNQGIQEQISPDNSQILTLSNSGQVQIQHSQDFTFAVSQGVEVDSMVLKKANLHLEITSTIPAPSQIIITIPALLKNGQQFKKTLNLLGAGSNIQTDYNLRDYVVNLTKNGTTHNTIEVEYTATITGNGASVSNSDRINISTEFQNIAYRILYGYTGQQNLGSIPDTVELSIFKNATGSGSFTIAEPKIRFDISNSLGIPLDARIAQLTGINSNQTGFVVATGIPDPLPVNSPVLSQLGQTMNSSFTMDNNNSNINPFMNVQPSSLLVQSQLLTNPSGRSMNFITDSSLLSLDVHVELPLYGTANNFEIRDTVPFNYNDLEKVESLSLRMNIENWFPMDANIQLIFADENFIALDTLFVPGEVVVPSGIISISSERTTAPGYKIHNHNFEHERLTKILHAPF